MKNDMDDLLNSVFGSRRTFSAPKPKAETPKKAKSARPAASAEDSMDAIQRAVAENQRILTEKARQQSRDIAALNESAIADIERISRELQSPAVQNLATGTSAAREAPKPMAAGRGAEGFSGAVQALEQKVFGQEAFLKSLVIAFKRPYVMGHEGERARNAMLVCGAPCTGRRLALRETVRFLKDSGVFASADTAWVDLALYPSPSQEKLFLQDLYAALAGDAEVVVFDHYEACHSGFLNVLSELVTEGKARCKAGMFCRTAV